MWTKGRPDISNVIEMHCISRKEISTPKAQLINERSAQFGRIILFFSLLVQSIPTDHNGNIF